MMNRGWETACGVHLNKGQKWVIFADYDQEDRQWEIVSGWKYDGKRDDDDLRFLRDAGAGRLEAKITGRVAPAFIVEDDRFANAEVVVEKEGFRRVVTADGEGSFQFVNLSPGDYSVRITFKVPVGAMWIYISAPPRYLNNDRTIEYGVHLGRSDEDYRYIEVYSKR
jgi:hypothetical protein